MMNHMLAKGSGLFKAFTCLAGLLTAMSVYAAGNTLIPEDSNTGLTVENAVINGNKTTVLFWTYPNRGDPGAGKACPLNFYTVSVEPGLLSAATHLAARDVCGNSLSKRVC